MHSVASLATPISSTDLTAFVVAVEAGSVQGAADALELTQSAVTKRIHSLERRLGDDLLERGRFGVRPTALGQTLYPQAKRALASLQELAALADVAGQQRAVNLQLVSSLTI